MAGFADVWRKLTGFCGTARALGEVVISGLWVLGYETAWLLGPDFSFRGRLRAMRARRDALQNEVAQLSTLADPRRDQVSGDLALLMGDLARVEEERVTRRKEWLRGMQRHLPRTFIDA